MNIGELKEILNQYPDDTELYYKDEFLFIKYNKICNIYIEETIVHLEELDGEEVILDGASKHQALIIKELIIKTF